MMNLSVVKSKCVKDLTSQTSMVSSSLYCIQSKSMGPLVLYASGWMHAFISIALCWNLRG